MNRAKRKRLREAGWKVGSAEEFLRLRRRDVLARWFVQRVRLSDMMGVRMPSGMGVAWVDPLSARMVMARIPLNFILAAGRDAWYAIGRFLRRDASAMSRRERAIWDKAHEEGRRFGQTEADRKHLDGTPDPDYPRRILEVYRRDADFRWSDSPSVGEGTDGGIGNPLIARLNKIQEQRAAILDSAIATLARAETAP